MSKSTKAAAAAAASTAPPPQYRPPPIPLPTLLTHTQSDTLLPTLSHTTLQSAVQSALRRLHYAAIESVAERYVAEWAVLDALDVVRWRAVGRDEGEGRWLGEGWHGMAAGEEVERLRHLWVPEDEPLPCTMDRWARHVLPVAAAAQDESGKDEQPMESITEAVAVASVSSEFDDGTPSEPASVPLESTAPFPVVSVSTTTAAFAPPALPTRSTSVRPTNPHRALSPSTATRPRPSVTAAPTSSPAQPATLATAFQSTPSPPYPLPSSSPPAASEQQRLALMAALRQQQAEMAERKRKDRERSVEEERRRDEERAKERALMSARRQKAVALLSARPAASDPATSQPKPRKQPLPATTTRTPTEPHEEKQQLTSPTSRTTHASPTSPRPAATTLPALRSTAAQPPPARPAHARRPAKPAPDDSTVDGYVGVAALQAAIVRSFVPAAGVRLVCGAEVKAGAEAGGGGGGEGRGRGVSVEDEQWASVVRGMNRSQYMRWMDDQRAQAAKEADIHMRQHSQLAATITTAQPTQPQQPYQPQPSRHDDTADQHSTPLPHQPPPPARLRLSSDSTAQPEHAVQLTSRAAVVLQPRVVSRERSRELSFDSRIVADSAWGSQTGPVGGRGAGTEGRGLGVGYEMIGRPRSGAAVKERKVVVSVPRKRRQLKASADQQVVQQQSADKAKVRTGSAGEVTSVVDKSRIAALLQVGKGREVGTDAADGEQ